MKKTATKIIATIGPATRSIESLKKLIEAGVDVFRLNLSHNFRSWHEDLIKDIKSISSSAQVLIDTRGPEIRLGDFDGIIKVKENELFILITDLNGCNKAEKKIPVSYDKICQTVEKGDFIAIDGGMLYGEVLEVKKACVLCRAMSDWDLSSRRHVNLPGERVDLPTITKQDEKDLIHFSKTKDVDFVALSFSRTKEAIDYARKLIPGKKIIAKVENWEGVENFSEILKASDGIMVARGDLGVEMSLEKIPILQRKMLREAKKENKISIVATEMLESMISSPRPTRAEVSDIATAVWERCHYVMLSGETTIGKYPLKAVSIMKKVIDLTEKEDDMYIN